MLKFNAPVVCRRTVFAIAAAIAFPGLAHAHASLETKEGTVGGSYKAVVKIGHGCGASATTKLHVKLPAGVIAAKPMPKAGWSLTTVKAAYGKSYNYWGGKQVAEGVTDITWTGGPLLDDNYDEFTFTAFLTDSLAPGSTAYFPVVQTCEQGENRWVDIPAVGQDAHALKSPAPGLKILAAAPAHAHVAPPAASKAYTLGTLVIEAPWARATPGGAKVAGGYLRITNKGQLADRMTGGTLAAAGRVEIHDMAITDGVMKMRMLPDGLVIKPGETVELKPGANHLMFMELTSGLVAGQPVKGSIQFEKAGRIDVDFTVAPVGAPGPAPSHH
jgi:periplasmic copper chaperone A